MLSWQKARLFSNDESLVEREWEEWVRIREKVERATLAWHLSTVRRARKTILLPRRLLRLHCMLSNVQRVSGYESVKRRLGQLRREREVRNRDSGRWQQLAAQLAAQQRRTTEIWSSLSSTRAS